MSKRLENDGKGMFDPEKQGMLAEKPPKDNYHIVYLITLLHGIGVLMPWNMFITIAPAYFVEYKLQETDSDGVRIPTPYSVNFFSYLGICSQLPNLLLNLVNIFIKSQGGLGRRIGVSLVIVGIICVITMILTLVDTSSSVAAFFFFTMVTVIILNGANGIYQNSVYGLFALFPLQFTNAIVLGNNLCGTFVSLISIFTLIVSNNIKVAAFMYFAIALLTISACFITFFMLPRFEFYSFYIRKSEAEQRNQMDANDGKEDNKWALYLDVFKQAWVQCLNVFLVFFVSLSIFPAIMADVKIWREDGVYDFFIPERLFTPITTFLLFNFLAMIGSTLANFVQWPSPRYLIIFTTLRILLIPIMMFCNYRPKYRSWPVFITSEYVYISFAVFMSFTSGYFSSLGMMYCPKVVDKSKAPIAGMMSAFFLICGICGGIAFTFLESLFIDSLGPYAAQSAQVEA